MARVYQAMEIFPGRMLFLHVTDCGGKILTVIDFKKITWLNHFAINSNTKKTQSNYCVNDFYF